VTKNKKDVGEKHFLHTRMMFR